MSNEQIRPFYMYAVGTVPIVYSAEELDGGRFWTRQQILNAIGQNILTPNFESEYLRFFK